MDQAEPRARGREHGRVGSDRVAANLHSYDELFRAVGVPQDRLQGYGTEALEAVAEWAPVLLEEMRGIAEGADVEAWQIGLMNARTEVLATVGATAEGECSTGVWVPPSGAPLTVQTWDWHDTMDDGKVVLRTPTAGGETLRLFTEAGIVGKIGIRSGRLGVHFNILGHQQDGNGIGVPVHVVARRILDEARTVAEAVALARSAPVSASTAITVVTYDGNRGSAVSIELSSAGVAVIEPDDDGFLLHTNHFLDAGLAAGESAAATASTYARLKHLASRRELLTRADPVERVEALHVHDVDGAPLCCHPLPNLPFHEQWRTLLTVELDFERDLLQFHDGGPCSVRAATWQTW